MIFRGDVSIPKLFYELIQEKSINRDRFMLPNKVDIEWIKRYDDDEVTIAAGRFETPNQLIGSHLPKESKKAYIQFVLPRSWENNHTGPKPVAIILPGTAEEGFERRRELVSYPLAARGVATIVLTYNIIFFSSFLSFLFILFIILLYSYWKVHFMDIGVPNLKVISV